MLLYRVLPEGQSEVSAEITFIVFVIMFFMNKDCFLSCCFNVFLFQLCLGTKPL